MFKWLKARRPKVSYELRPDIGSDTFVICRKEVRNGMGTRIAIAVGIRTGSATQLVNELNALAQGKRPR